MGGGGGGGGGGRRSFCSSLTVLPRTVIDHTAYRFRVDGKYLFVSRQNYSRHAVVGYPTSGTSVCDVMGPQRVGLVFVM